MEVDQQVMACGTLKQVDTIVHVKLTVAREKVDLHACHTDFLTPSELFLTVLRLIEAELRGGGAIDPTHG